MTNKQKTKKRITSPGVLVEISPEEISNIIPINLCSCSCNGLGWPQAGKGERWSKVKGNLAWAGTTRPCKVGTLSEPSRLGPTLSLESSVLPPFEVIHLTISPAPPLFHQVSQYRFQCDKHDTWYKLSLSRFLFSLQFFVKCIFLLVIFWKSDWNIGCKILSNSPGFWNWKVFFAPNTIVF